MYLLPQSSHYQSMYRNIPYGVALRLRRICSRYDWFYEQLQDFKQYFRRRRYSNKIINNGFNRAIYITRSDALLPESREPDNFKNLVLVMDYHPNFIDVPKLIKDHLQILYESPRMKKVFSSPRGGGGHSITKHTGWLAQRSESKPPKYLSKNSNIKKMLKSYSLNILKVQS